MTTTTAPTTTAPTTTPTAPVRLREHWAMPTWLIADDPVILAHAARVLSESGLCVMELPDGGDLPPGALELWVMGLGSDAAEVQLLLAAAGIPAVVTAVEILDLETGETIDMVEPAEAADDPRALAAHHEAGHAVAGCLRGSILRSIALGEVDGDGLTVHRGPCWDDPFVSFAGPWAEARYIWGDRPADEENEDYLVFADHLFGIFLGAGAEDWAVLQAHFDGYAGLATMLPPQVTAGDLVRLTEQVWARELQAVWPAIETVATRLLAGEECTHARVNTLLEAC